APPAISCAPSGKSEPAAPSNTLAGAAGKDSKSTALPSSRAGAVPPKQYGGSRFGRTATPRLYQITPRKVNRSPDRTRTCNLPLTKSRNSPRRRRRARLLVPLGLAPAPVAAPPLAVRDSAVGVCDSLVINLPRLPRQPLGVPPCLRLLLEGLHVVAEAPAVVPQCRQHAAGLLLVLLRSTALSVGDIAHNLGHRVSLQRVLVYVADECQRPVVQQRVVKRFKSRNHGLN